MPESRFSLGVRLVLSLLLLFESLALLLIGGFVVVVGSVVGALAIGAGAGGATDEQLRSGVAAMVVSLASPFAVAGAVGLAGFFLLLRSKRWLVVAAAVVALAWQAAFHVLVARSFDAMGLLPVAVHVATIAAALLLVPAGAPRTARKSAG